MGRRGDELWAVRGSRKVGGRLVFSLRRLVRAVPRRAVVVGVPGLDSRLVEGVLLRGGVRPAEPGQGPDGLGDDHEQRQDARGHSPELSGTEERSGLEAPS